MEKSQTKKILTELKKQKINGVYLKKAKLDDANLHEEFLSGAELQKRIVYFEQTCRVQINL
jgi:uncharacterized protein YjbI with pentapeptide repeats